MERFPTNLHDKPPCAGMVIISGILLVYSAIIVPVQVKRRPSPQACDILNPSLSRPRAGAQGAVRPPAAE